MLGQQGPQTSATDDNHCTSLLCAKLYTQKKRLSKPKERKKHLATKNRLIVTAKMGRKTARTGMIILQQGKRRKGHVKKEKLG